MKLTTPIVRDESSNADIIIFGWEGGKGWDYFRKFNNKNKKGGMFNNSPKNISKAHNVSSDSFPLWSWALAIFLLWCINKKKYIDGIYRAYCSSLKMIYLKYYDNGGIRLV